MTATKEIEEWVKEHGSERDALNAALAQLQLAKSELQSAHLEIAELMEEAEQQVYLD